MKREIKFKALVARKERPSYWAYYHIGTKPVLDENCFFIVEDLQFTGLLDKKGKEIYEGDVLNWMFEYNDYPPQMLNVTVTYQRWEGDMVGYNIANGCEIVGNIYENPELLK
jgi:hypothetical protein